MDGAQDRPPGRTAENWSRNDRIRAGAVSGPWRSAPRSTQHEPEPKPEAETPHAETPLPAAAPQAAAAPRPAPKPAVKPAPVQPAAAARPAVPQAAGRSSMIAWTGFGIAFAAACIGLAFVFQPEGQAPDGAPAPVEKTAPAETAGAGPGVAATGAAGEAAAVPMPEPEALAGVTNVRLRTGTGLADAVRDAVTAALGKAGLSDVQLEALPFAVATSRVGYYRPEDKAAAEALAAYIGPVLGYGGPIAVRDYAALLDNAEPGRLDLWLAGS